MKEAAEEELNKCNHEDKRRIECAASHLSTKLQEFAKLICSDLKFRLSQDGLVNASYFSKQASVFFLLVPSMIQDQIKIVKMLLPVNIHFIGQVFWCFILNALVSLWWYMQ